MSLGYVVEKLFFKEGLGRRGGPTKLDHPNILVHSEAKILKQNFLCLSTLFGAGLHTLFGFGKT